MAIQFDCRLRITCNWQREYSDKEKQKYKAVAEACGRYDEYFAKATADCRKQAVGNGWDLERELCSKCKNK